MAALLGGGHHQASGDVAWDAQDAAVLVEAATDFAPWRLLALSFISPPCRFNSLRAVTEIVTIRFLP